MFLPCENYVEDLLAMLLEESLDAMADGLRLNHSNNRRDVDLAGMGDELVVNDVAGAE